jgi:ABC-type sugar transport system permease subunit
MRGKGQRDPGRKVKTKAAYLLIPAAGFFLLSFAAPLVLVGRLSLFQADYITSRFVGFGNYLSALHDRYFLRSMENAAIYLLVLVPFVTTISYKVASLLSDMGKRLANAGRTLFYLPTLSAGLIISLVWRWAFASDGLANWVVGRRIGWMAQPWPARFMIMVIVSTVALGGYVVMFSASMSGLSSELRDASRIDGASTRQYKRLIQWPLMVPAFLIVVTLVTVQVLQVWETVYIMTNGGPAGYTASPVYDIYVTAFQNGQHGLAAAKSVIFLLIVAGVMGAKRAIER